MADVRDVKKACMHYSTTPTPQNGRTPYTELQELVLRIAEGEGARTHAYIIQMSAWRRGGRGRERETDTADAAM